MPSRLADAGVSLVAGDARGITYRVGAHAVTAELLVAERISSAAKVLDYLRRRPGHRVLVVCETITDEARSALLHDGAVDLSISDTGELVLSGAVYRAPTPAHPGRAVNQRRRRRRAAERVCVLTREHLRQSDIAAAVGVSQQAVSLMASSAARHTMTEAARRERLAALSSVPADDGLVETYWYGMESAVEQVQRDRTRQRADRPNPRGRRSGRGRPAAMAGSDPRTGLRPGVDRPIGRRLGGGHR